MLLQLGADIGLVGSMWILDKLWFGNALDLAYLLKCEPEFPIATEMVDVFSSQFEKVWKQMKPARKYNF